jgi:hypothetical protein
VLSSKDSRKATLELGGGRYSQWKKKLVETERHILKELGFGFYQVMQHPHKFLLYYIKYLSQQGMVADEGKLRQLAQHAWAYLNDSMRLDMCVRFESRHVACASIMIASRQPDVAVVLPSPEWILALGKIFANLKSELSTSSQSPILFYLYQVLTQLLCMTFASDFLKRTSSPCPSG